MEKQEKLPNENKSKIKPLIEAWEELDTEKDLVMYDPEDFQQLPLYAVRHVAMNFGIPLRNGDKKDDIIKFIYKGERTDGRKVILKAPRLDDLKPSPAVLTRMPKTVAQMLDQMGYVKIVELDDFLSSDKEKTYYIDKEAGSVTFKRRGMTAKGVIVTMAGCSLDNSERVILSTIEQLDGSIPNLMSDTRPINWG